MAPPLLVSFKSQPDWPVSSSSRSTGPLRLSVLDSCFNPPSLAHYAMATHDASSYAAHLLLLSSKNVDKVHKEGDTSFDERTEMMTIEAKKMVSEHTGCKTVAVASLAAATFAEKAPIILDYLRERHPSQQITLVFYIGFDTVVRLFAKKYYGDSDEEMENILDNFFITDGCEVVCARRPVESVAQQDVAGREEKELVETPLAKRYIDMGKLHLADIPDTEGISSTKIRNILKEASGQEAMQQLGNLAHSEIVDYCLQRSLYRDSK